MREIDEIAIAGLLHDIGKFGQRADNYKLKDIYKSYDYKYTHAAYSAQILNEMIFNLGSTLSDDAAMHHKPQNDNQWIIASADRMASGFEREKFKKYNEAYDKEDFKKQRLWHLFDENKKFKIDTLNPDNLFPQKDNAITNEYDELWKKFFSDMEKIKKQGNSSIDFFTIDYLLKKYTTFIPSSTSFKAGGYDAVKANISLYEHSKATSIFTAAISKLHKANNLNILNYYRGDKSDIEQKDLLMICGDFFGIQKFIFDSVEAKNASKILRAKSAYVQLLTKAIAFFIVEELRLSYQSIISTSAGKFEILGVNTDEAKDKLKQIQQKLNAFFIEEYFGETGVGICFVPCALADFIVENRYKQSLRKRIDTEVEKVKFKKFDLLHVEPILKSDTFITNETLCPLCHKRKIEDKKRCNTCDKFVQIGEKLTKGGYLIFSYNHGQIKLFEDIHVSFSQEPQIYKDKDIAIFDIGHDDAFKGYAKWELASYVATKEEKEIKTFEELAQSSVKIGKDEQGKRVHGVEALMVLKGDVDSMGIYIKDEKNEVTNSFARFNFFSRMVDYFFSVKASKMMEGRDIYTVFAGGDDIFILGAWDEVIDFAKELREAFVKFASQSPLSLSVGMVMVKSNKPINFVANIAKEALDTAKSMEHKDAISLFGETVKWDDYLDDLGLGEELQLLNNPNTAFLYRLLELIEMSKKVKYNRDVASTIWKSKLNYTFTRNNAKSHEGLLECLFKMIENYPKEAKMVLSEYIYKRRES
ncbi:MAG: type III-A CRISPR-associated protein Cas10/Csm1 [Sulfurospirillum sp.]|nr:type III-A CRISPR-associated protein Cas10/Csm1 [Sulfurospirillum sp.]